MRESSLADYVAIYGLFARYTAALDSRDVDTVVDCFLPDGTLSSPTIGVFKGHAQIREFATRFARFQEAGVQMRHCFFDLVVEADGDEAHAMTYLLISHTSGEKLTLQPPGRYDCRVARRDGRWRFKSRVVLMDAEARLGKV